MKTRRLCNLLPFFGLLLSPSDSELSFGQSFGFTYLMAMGGIANAKRRRPNYAADYGS